MQLRNPKLSVTFTPGGAVRLLCLDDNRETLADIEITRETAAVLAADLASVAGPLPATAFTTLDEEAMSQ